MHRRGVPRRGLDFVCKQANLTWIVRPDGVELLTPDERNRETGMDDSPDDSRSRLPLVCVSVGEKPLIDVLNKLVDQGNTVVVIEHNLDVILAADHVIDLGPEGGAGGGRVIAQGTPEEVAQLDASATGRFLAGLLNDASGSRSARQKAI